MRVDQKLMWKKWILVVPCTKTVKQMRTTLVDTNISFPGTEFLSSVIAKMFVIVIAAF